jgi:hypothetical protein
LPLLLDEEAIERLRARLDAGPTPEDGTCTLRGPEIRALLARVRRELLLHRLGYSCLDPRPRAGAN